MKVGYSYPLGKYFAGTKVLIVGLRCVNKLLFELDESDNEVKKRLSVLNVLDKYRRISQPENRELLDAVAGNSSLATES